MNTANKSSTQVGYLYKRFQVYYEITDPSAIE